MGRSLLFSALVAMSMFAVVGLFISSGNVSAGIGPKVVSGYIYDSEGNPVNGANVVVNIIHNSVVTATKSYTTGSSGYYMVSFAPAEWQVGDTLEVLATKGSDQGDNSKVITGEGGESIDVHFETAIPQFGSLVGVLLAAGLMGGVAIVFLRSGRNRKS